ncbi:M20/M25/M40 family metallo-hydrolase [Kribbella sp. NPDC048928]|uniref:M20/M25/M40 family metallo-hydrolase n=1 Tax=Kribbella sp. NPDC048928 TaxID=3364111 RepID=UPI0037202354
MFRRAFHPPPQASGVPRAAALLHAPQFTEGIAMETPGGLAVSPELLQYCEQQVDAVIRTAEQLIRSESPSADQQAIARSAELVHRIGSDLMGAPGVIHEVDGCSNVSWTFGAGTRGSVLVLGHHDTVWPHGTIGRIPFAATPTVRGPGCLDMKVGVAIAFHAVAMLRPADGIEVLITGDEELGSPSSRALIADRAARATAALVFESGADDGSLKTARKGRSQYRLVFRGRGAHAGLEPERGANALVELSAAVLAIEALGNQTGGTTVVPSVATAGTTVNTVPDHAELQVDVRSDHLAELERVDREIRRVGGRVPGTEIVVHGGIDRPPLTEDMSAPLLSRARSIWRALGLGELGGARVGGGSDGNLTASAGVPTLDGLGAVGAGPHADHEYVDRAQLAGRLALAVSLLAELTGTEVTT